MNNIANTLVLTFGVFIGLIIGLFISISIAHADEMPEPLTLEYALTLVDENNPIVALANEQVAASNIQTHLAQADTGYNVTLQSRARWVESPKALQYLGREDYAAKLVLNKTLYDFGRTSNNVRANKKIEQRALLQKKENIQLHRLRIMRAYFDVILADLMFARDNEAMAMGYIYYDRTKERASVGQRSALDVLEKDSEYQKTRQARYFSESQQRLTRNYLSLLIDRPKQLPSKLTMPSFRFSKIKIKSVDALYEAALLNNLELKSQKLKLASLIEQKKSLRAQRRPIISAEVEAGMYERNIGGNDVWRAGIMIDVPLFQGGKVGYMAQLKNTEIDTLKIFIYQTEWQIKQSILAHWLAINDLSVQRQASHTLYDYREYYLDRARALYEMEVTSDLGDAMVELTAASFKIAEAQFETTMRWEKIAQLTQMKVEELVQ